MAFKKTGQASANDKFHLLQGIIATAESQQVIENDGLDNIPAGMMVPYMKFLVGNSQEVNPGSEAYDENARIGEFYIAGATENNPVLGKAAYIQFVKVAQVMKVLEFNGVEFKEVAVEAATPVNSKLDKLNHPAEPNSVFYGRTVIKDGKAVQQKLSKEWRALTFVATENEKGELAFEMVRMFFSAGRAKEFQNFLNAVKLDSEAKALYSKLYKISATMEAITEGRGKGGTTYSFSFEPVGFSPDELITKALEAKEQAQLILEGGVEQPKALPASAATVPAIARPAGPKPSLATTPPGMNLVADEED